MTKLRVHACAPGQGEHLLTGIDTVALGYRCTECVTTPKAMHFVLTKGG